MDRYFWEEKETLSKIENAAQELSDRLLLCHQVLMREPKIFCINQKNKFTYELNKIVPKNTKRKCFRGKMARVEHTYNVRFEGNILIVGQTGCGKTIL